MLSTMSKYVEGKETCQKCGQRHLLIPCVPKETDQSHMHLAQTPAITYLCNACRLGVQGEMDEIPTQLWVRPGTYGLISPKIRKVLPSCLWAGKVVRTCQGFPIIWLEMRHMTPDPMKVPVRLRTWDDQHPPFSIELDYLLFFEQAPGDSLATVFTHVPFYASQ